MPSSSRRAVGHSPERRSTATRRCSAHLDELEDQPSPGKRPKLQRTPETPVKQATAAAAGASVSESMYSFSSNVIDLTSSPPRKPGASSQSGRPAASAKASSAGGPHAGAKKLVVKNLKQTSRNDPEKYLNLIWDQVNSALSAIFSEHTKKYSLEELYRGVENVCRQNYAAEISKRLRARCTEHINTVVKPRLLQSKDAGTDRVVVPVVEEWLRWRKQSVGTVRFPPGIVLTARQSIIKAIFYYLDRAYLLHSASEQTIDEMCIELFRDQIFYSRELKSKIVEGTCAMLAADRSEKPTSAFDPELFRHLIAMFHAMTIYTVEIESKILGKSQSFFVDWTEEHSKSDDLTRFLKESQELKSNEVERCNLFALPDSTKRELVIQMDKYLIEHQVDRLTRATDIARLVNANDNNNLSSLFAWLQIKELGEKLKGPISAYIIEEGTKIVFDEKRENEMVRHLLLLKQQVDAIWERAFAKNQGLGHAMRQAFDEFMNKNKRDEATGGAGNDKPGEMIAKYVDVILKGGTKAIPAARRASMDPTTTDDDMQRQDDELDEEEVINCELDRVLDLFRFVQGKATFEAFYKKDLAKRLLMNRSASADAEKSMLTRLRNNCGASFTHNLEQMFKDIERSREENTTYKSLLEDRNSKTTIDLNVNTLSAAAWPSYPNPEVEIPPDIQKATRDFEVHYKSKYVGRKLDWKHGLAHCQMRARFPSGQKELILSSFQAIVLLQFNDRGPENTPLGYAELQAATKLSDAELQRTLQSLACANYRVLTKSPRGKEVAPTDRFAVNLSFTDVRARIKINQIQLKETPEEQKQTHERVATDRQFETQAAIVRILKREKKIKHALLVVEVISALKSRGAINAEDIKKQIEKLIDKDYMERAEDGSYEYLA